MRCCTKSIAQPFVAYHKAHSFCVRSMVFRDVFSYSHEHALMYKQTLRCVLVCVDHLNAYDILTHREWEKTSYLSIFIHLCAFNDSFFCCLCCICAMQLFFRLAPSAWKSLKFWFSMQFFPISRTLFRFIRCLVLGCSCYLLCLVVHIRCIVDFEFVESALWVQSPSAPPLHSVFSPHLLYTNFLHHCE